MVNLPISRNIILGSVMALALSTAIIPNASAQDAAAEAEYAAILQQIADVKLATAQKQVYINSQQQKIASLEAQMAGIPATSAAVVPLLEKMAASIETEIQADVPFKIDERLIRLDKFRETLADATATPGQKMRQALNIYGIEVGYGNSVASYVGNNPKTPGTRFEACQADESSRACGLTEDHKKKMGYDEDGNKTGNGATVSDLKDELMDGAYLHYGRLALVYLEYDSSEAWRYDKEAKDWVELSGGDVLDVRRAVRIARGQSAPGVLAAPVNLVR
ncbi:DUF3450 domain-containing protein [Hellea sp.]|nr:DUF3450 domain-containing protein [Hellea sp.]